jgi:hypothetical protein
MCPATILLLSNLNAYTAGTKAQGEARLFSHPGGMHTAAQIESIRCHRGEEPWKSAYAQLLRRADQALSQPCHAVENLVQPFYYWDPKRSEAAKKRLSDDASAAYALALAYPLEQGQRRGLYADEAISLLNGWATVNRRVSGSDGPLIMCYAGLPMIFAADLLWDYGGWTDEGRGRFRTWVESVFLRCAKQIRNRPNNWGCWGIFASIAASHLLDDRAAVLADIESLKQRIAESIAPNGELPHENRRTNSGMWYTYFSLGPLTGAAWVAWNATGTNLFEYTAPNGRTIKQALDRFFYYCQNPQAWPYRKPPGWRGWLLDLAYASSDTLIVPAPQGIGGNLYEAMSWIYHQTQWEDWIRAARPIHGGRGWVYPTLMRQR